MTQFPNYDPANDLKVYSCDFTTQNWECVNRTQIPHARSLNVLIAAKKETVTENT